MISTAAQLVSDTLLRWLEPTLLHMKRGIRHRLNVVLPGAGSELRGEGGGFLRANTAICL